MIDSFTGEWRLLSNFYPSEIRMDGVLYSTVEHAYQASKTMDPEMRAHIAMLPRPHQAKHWGRRVELREDWDNIKIGIMHDLVRLKFKIPALRQRLLDTGEQPLVEGNNWGDRFWGQVNGQGHNHLGLILMAVRKEIQGG